jgi:four helix bundle protein
MARLTGDLKERTLTFVAMVLEAVPSLPNDSRGWVIGKQVVRAATSVGANIWEADVAQSDSDFAHKISIARKEASETQYWFALIRRSKLLPQEVWSPLAAEAEELVRILSVVVRKTQEHIHRG